MFGESYKPKRNLSFYVTNYSCMFYGGILGPNGKIIIIPFSSTNILDLSTEIESR